MKKLFSILSISALLCISRISCSAEPNTTPTVYDPSLAAITILDGKVTLNIEAYEYPEIFHSEFCKDVINEAVSIYNEIAGSDVRIPNDKQIDYEALCFVGSCYEDLPKYLQSKSGEHQTYYKNHKEVFTAVEQMPQFPGGEAELMNWISNHIKYPTMAMENNVQGQVVVQFVITKDGSIGDVKVVRSRDADLDKEAVRVVKSLPKFIPGKMNGQPVNVWYTLPIIFKLPEK